MAPTPKTQERKRKSTASANSSTPAKRRSTRGKDTVINLDEDPFNFENEANSHPEPLKNISVSACFSSQFLLITVFRLSALRLEVSSFPGPRRMHRIIFIFFAVQTQKDTFLQGSVYGGRKNCRT